MTYRLPIPPLNLSLKHFSTLPPHFKTSAIIFSQHDHEPYDTHGSMEFVARLCYSGGERGAVDGLV